MRGEGGGFVGFFELDVSQDFKAELLWLCYSPLPRPELV